MIFVDYLRQFAGYRHLFQNRNYVLLFWGSVISSLGDEIGRIGLALFIYNQTNSALAAGAFFATLNIAFIIMGPLLSFLSDYKQRKTVMILCDIVRAILICLVPFTTEIWQILVVGFLIATFASVFRPTRQAVIPEVVGKEHIAMASALANASYGLIRIIGPFFGTLLLVSFTVDVIIWIDGATYLISAILTSLAIIPQLKRINLTTGVSNYLETFLSGFRFIYRTHSALSVSLIWSLVAFVIGAMPVFLLQSVDGASQSEVDYGSLITVLGIGVTVGGLYAGRSMTDPQRMRLAYRSALLVVTLMALLAPLSQSVVGYAVIFALGLAEGGFLVSCSALWAIIVPNEIRGRSSAAINAIIQVGTLTGGIISGVIIDSYPQIPSFIIVSGILIIAVFLVGRRMSISSELITLGESNVTNGKM